MSEDLRPVAFDIETTGLTVEDAVTVVGFELPLGAAVFLNTGGRAVDTEHLERDCSARAGREIQLTVTESEEATLRAVATFLAETCVPRNYYLVGYNAEVWNGGFDLAFLRTRYAALDLDWPFVLPYVDLLPVFDDRVNTRISPDAEVCDLDGIYEWLVGGSHCDPFEDSASAVTAWERGAFADLLCHNIADIGRTQALAVYAERYVPQSDFQMKNLEPP